MIRLRPGTRRLGVLKTVPVALVAALLLAGYMVDRRAEEAVDRSPFPLSPDPAEAALRPLPEGVAGAGGAAPLPVATGPGRTVEGELGEGERFVDVLERLALSRDDVYAAVAAAGQVFGFRRLRAGHRWSVDLAADGQILGFRIVVSPLEVYRVERGGEGWVAQREEVAVRREVVTLSGEATSSLWSAVKELRADPSVIPLLTECFEWDIDFNTDTRSGDRFAVIVERLLVDEQFVRYGDLLAAAYEGVAAGSHRVIPWAPPDGPAGLYNPDGVSVRKTFLKSPLTFTHISSGFDRNRFHPILHRTRAHMGVDYAAPRGTPVRAVGDGKVVFAGWKGGNGKLVSVLHDNGFKSHYAHLSSIRQGIEVGAAVRQRELLGRVGATGLATGPHLHFGMSKGSQFVNPLTLDRLPERSLEGDAKERYLAHAVPLAARLEALMRRAGPDGGLPF